jgi:isopentenyl diphosphate isomerase/L-lactate dehydrogenase-like FMN-dependent dehydrogenase
MSQKIVSRRQVLERVGAVVAGTVAGSKLATGQAPSATITQAQTPRLAPRDELVNTLEFEEEARKKLAPAVFALVAGGDRAMFDRVTLRPRMLMPTIDMDLSQTILGDTHFVPILVGPVADQKRFHPDGELATARGSAAARAFMIVSSQSSTPVDRIAAENRSFWYQVFASESAAKTQIADGVKAGARAVVITVGVNPGAAKPTSTGINWATFENMKKGVTVPVLVKGIASPADATAALARGAQGIIVSNYGGLLASKEALILELPRIVDTVAGKVPVLVDGSFRRGTDVIKALAFGAQGVIVSRPAMWGLAGYGADGVRTVVELLQTELSRYMGMCGKSNLKALDRTLVKVHGSMPAKTSTSPAATGS